VCNGLVANGVSNMIESVIWTVCSATIRNTDDLVFAMFWAQVFAYFVLRTVTQKIWRLTRGDEEESGAKKVSFDFKHFRERQGLLIILVLGEAITASVLTEEVRVARRLQFFFNGVYICSSLFRSSSK
jgi:hypothetical protein